MADTRSDGAQPVLSPAQYFVEEAEQQRPPNTDAARFEEKGIEMLNMSAQIAADLNNWDKAADIKLKKIYGIGILIVLGIWEVFVIVYSIIQIFYCYKVRHVSDTVMIALWTSATANILALPAIILNYLFPKRSHHE